MKKNYMSYFDVKEELEHLEEVLHSMRSDLAHQFRKFKIVEDILKIMKPEDVLLMNKDEFYNYLFSSIIIYDLKIKKGLEQSKDMEKNNE